MPFLFFPISFLQLILVQSQTPSIHPPQLPSNHTTLQTSLAGTSAEFLLNPAPITSSDKLPELAPFSVPVELYLTVKNSTDVPSLED